MKYSFIVGHEFCPKCKRETHEQDAIRVQVNGSPAWTTASANSPYGEATEDAMGPNDPGEEDCPTLFLDTDDITITCASCGTNLPYTAHSEN